MQPDYFAILRSLYEFRIAKQVGAKANSLLVGIIWKANVMRFPDSLAIWNSEARDIAGLTEEELVAARNRLTQLEINGQFILRYQTGGTRSPGKYQLNYSGLSSYFTPSITPEIPGNVLGNLLGNVGGNLQGNPPGNEGVISILTKQTNKQTNKKPPTDHHDEQPPKVAYAEYVYLTPAEHERLVNRFGQADTSRMIEILDNYIGQNPVKNGKRYTDHNRVLQGWVKDRLQEEKERRSKGSRATEDYGVCKVPY